MGQWRRGGQERERNVCGATHKNQNFKSVVLGCTVEYSCGRSGHSCACVFVCLYVIDTHR